MLLFASGKREEGEKICREVMRIEPYRADVYQTLGAMIEESGQRRKSTPSL